MEKSLPAGQFVCEYKTGIPPYPRAQRESWEEEYTANNEGCYILEAQTSDGKCGVGDWESRNTGTQNTSTKVKFGSGSVARSTTIYKQLEKTLAVSEPAPDLHSFVYKSWRS